jgi:hypothetical protein
MRSPEDRQRRRHRLEEAVVGVGVGAHVVLDAEGGEGRLEAFGVALQGRVLAAEARDDGADALELALGVVGHPAVVRGGRGEVVACRRDQREAATLAEADDADAARAVLAAGEPAARGLDVVEHRAGVRGHRLHRRRDAAGSPTAGGVEGGRHRQVARRGEALGVLAQRPPQAEGVLQDDDAGERAVADRRHGEERGLVTARGGGDVQVGHVCRPSIISAGAGGVERGSIAGPVRNEGRARE